MERGSRLRVAYTEMLLREYNRRMGDWPSVVARHEAAFQDPRGAQEGALLSILRAHAGSVYGQEHRFPGIGSYEQYRECVPVVDYETLRPYVERMLEGQPDVLVRGTAAYFSTTSGSMAAPKFVPGTLATITAGCDAILARNAYLRRDHPEVFQGRPLVVVGSMSEGTTPGGVTYGAMTGFGYHAAHMGFPGPALPYDLFAITDPSARYYAILRLALAARDLSALVAYNPSTLLRLLDAAREWWDEIVTDVASGTLSERMAVEPEIREALSPWLAPDPRRASELLSLRLAGPRAWWPALSLLMCWKGGAAGFYLDDLKRRIGGLPVREIGLLSSEASVSVAVDDGAGCVLLPGSGFFEFVPEGEGVEQARPAWDLEPAARYRVLATTAAGLYRYDLGDVVRVTGHEGRMPRIEFLHRAGRVYSFTGEKVTEHHVTLAVRSAADACRLPVAGFTAVPLWGQPPAYEVFAEPGAEESADAWAGFATSIDDALCRLNVEYRAKRRSGRLGPVTTTRVSPGTFERVRTHETRHDAQYKEMHLATDPGYRSTLTARSQTTC